MAILLVFVLGRDTNGNEYLAAGIDKEAKLAKEKKPKIIIIGGSNVAFGIDSEMIEKEFDMPTLNMGLSAGFGMRFMFNQIQNYTYSKDIIIFAPEYELFSNILDGKAALIEYLRVNPGTLQYLDAWQVPSLALNTIDILRYGVPKIISNPLRRSARRAFFFDEIYNRSAFDGRGDVQSHMFHGALKEKVEADMHWAVSLSQPSTSAIRLLNEFYDSVETRNVFLSFPPIPQNYYDANKDVIDRMPLLLKNIRLPIISKPEDYIFPIDYFFDTRYHLTNEGRIQRTQRLIRDLKSAGLTR